MVEITANKVVFTYEKEGMIALLEKIAEALYYQSQPNPTGFGDLTNVQKKALLDDFVKDNFRHILRAVSQRDIINPATEAARALQEQYIAENGLD